MQFGFATAGEIHFGAGCLSTSVQRLGRFGRRALVVTTSRPERAAPLLDQLDELQVAVSTLAVHAEPSVEVALAGVEQGREFEADFVIGIGGGSALDAAKAIAGLLANPGEPYDYLEVVGRGKPLEQPALPCIAIPTTAGTGSEVTKNAVLTSQAHQVKVSLRDPSLCPNLAIVDSRLTFSVPASVTAATGLDALTQCIEPYLSCFANPLTDGIALEGIRHGARSLEPAFRDGNDADAREGMALTSLFGGLCLANAKLGAVHGFAGPIGGMCHAPHGAVCARLLPLVFAANLSALRARAPSHPTLERLRVVTGILTGNPTLEAEAGIEWLERTVAALGIPGLEHYGLRTEQLPGLVVKAERASSMKGNPIPLTREELLSIAERALRSP